jgi:hypothetical protein
MARSCNPRPSPNGTPRNRTHILRDIAVLRNSPAPDRLLAIEDDGLRTRALEAWRAAEMLESILCGWWLYATDPRPEAIMTFPVVAAVETRLQVRALLAHGVAIRFFHGRGEAEIMGLFPRYPHGNIDAERDRAFLCEVRENMERLHGLREEIRDFLSLLVEYPDAALSAQDNPSVDDEDLAILRVWERCPGLRLTLDQITARTRPRVSRATVAKRIKRLLVARLVERPAGAKGGHVITRAGLNLLQTHPLPAP